MERKRTILVLCIIIVILDIVIIGGFIYIIKNTKQEEKHNDESKSTEINLFGLEREGYTCYFLSCLQFILRCNDICTYIEAQPVNKSKPLTTALAQIIKYKRQRDKKAINPASLFEVFKRTQDDYLKKQQKNQSNEFNKNETNNMQECFSFFIELIDNIENNNIRRFFITELTIRGFCNKCGGSIQTIKKEIDFFNVEVFYPEKKRYEIEQNYADHAICNFCKVKITEIESFMISKYPIYICTEHPQHIKLQSKVLFIEQEEYILIGLIIHSGTGQHYYAIIEDKKQWFICNDQNVTLCEDEKFNNLGNSREQIVFKLYEKKKKVLMLENRISE